MLTLILGAVRVFFPKLYGNVSKEFPNLYASLSSDLELLLNNRVFLLIASSCIDWITSAYNGVTIPLLVRALP